MIRGFKCAICLHNLDKLNTVFRKFLFQNEASLLYKHEFILLNKSPDWTKCKIRSYLPHRAAIKVRSETDPGPTFIEKCRTLTTNLLQGPASSTPMALCTFTSPKEV